MRKAKLQAATLGGNPDDIEAAFYDALRQGDIERLMACWADEEEIVCVHPGGPRLIGSGAIRATLRLCFQTVPCKRTLRMFTKSIHWPAPCIIWWSVLKC